MKYNLEKIPKESVVDRNGLRYADFRLKLKPDYFQVWLDIVAGYVALGLLITASIFIQGWAGMNILLILPCSIGLGLAIGYTIAYLQLFVHEAAHYNIYPNKKTNDLLADIVLCMMVGMNIESYRNIHWDHHKYLGKVSDTENSYFRALTIPFVFQTLTGIHLIRIFMNRQRRFSKSGNSTARQNKEIHKKDRLSLLAGLIFNLVVILTGVWLREWVLVVSWIFAFGLFFPFFATLRQLLEHRDEFANSAIDYSAVDHGPVVRLFRSNLVSRTFGGAGFVNHLLHHWDPSISYTRLPDLKKYLSGTDQCGDFIKESTTSYSATFFRLLKPGR